MTARQFGGALSTGPEALVLHSSSDVLAGDITMTRDYEELVSVFEPLARKYSEILYVPRNHEYYRSSPKQVTRSLAKLTKDIPAVVMPDNGAVVIDGHRFVAGTMWFRPDRMGELKRRFMHDFSLIQDFEPWVYGQNVAFDKALVTKTEPSDVVVTQHMPTPPRASRLGSRVLP